MHVQSCRGCKTNPAQILIQGLSPKSREGNKQRVPHPSTRRALPDSPHLQKNLPYFSPDLHERVQMTTANGNSQCIKVVRLELFCLPRTTSGHRRQDKVTLAGQGYTGGTRSHWQDKGHTGGTRVAPKGGVYLWIISGVRSVSNLQS